MTMMKPLTIAVGLFVSLTMAGFSAQASVAAADSDFLAQENINIGTTPDSTLDQVMNDIRAVFYKYKPAVDSSTKITKALRVTGSAAHPILQVSMEKCVVFYCQTVDMDAEVSLTQVQGRCERNLLLNVDLAKSSKVLTDVYDHLTVGICLSRTRDGQGTLKMIGEAHHAAQYSAGIVQKQIFGLLKLQVKPIVKALNDTLKEKKAAL